MKPWRGGGGPETIHRATLAEIEVVLVVDYAFDDGPDPGADATLRLGLEPVVLDILGRDRPRPTEVTVVRRASPAPLVMGLERGPLR